MRSALKLKPPALVARLKTWPMGLLSLGLLLSLLLYVLFSSPSAHHRPPFGGPARSDTVEVRLLALESQVRTESRAMAARIEGLKEMLDTINFNSKPTSATDEDFGPPLKSEEKKSLQLWYNTFRAKFSIPALPVSLQPGDGILDVGANMGVFSEKVLEVCPKCNVLAFECVTPYARFIRDNHANNPQLRVKPVGLSNEKGHATIYTDPGSNRGWNTMIKEQATKGMIGLDATFVRLDDVPAAQLPKNIKVIKIDTEGAEWRVIQGGKAFFASLPRPKPYILMEIAWGKAHPNWQLELESFEWLMNNGWKKMNIQDTSTYDALFVPE
jgi:FkbM family methyltransferase